MANGEQAQPSSDSQGLSPDNLEAILDFELDRRLAIKVALAGVAWVLGGIAEAEAEPVKPPGREVVLDEIQRPSAVTDALAAALERGKITSLDMRYDSKHGSHAVFGINGLGHPRQVLWVYRVNGDNSPKGCSLVKVKPGDRVTWHYIGQK